MTPIRILLLTLLMLAASAVCRAQSCRTLYQEANALVERGQLEKARERYQRARECGDALYVPDCTRRIAWIDRMLGRGDRQKPFAVSETMVTLPPTGGQDVVAIDGPQTWTARVNTAATTWCKLRPARGKLYIVCAANTTTTTRRATVTIRSGNQRRRVTVVAEAATAMLTASARSLAFPSGGGTARVEVTANQTWQTDTAAAWVTVSRDTAALALAIAPNISARERHATLHIVAGDKTATIDIRQQPADDDSHPVPVQPVITITPAAAPLVMPTPTEGIGGRAVAFGVSVGYVVPMVAAASNGPVTASLVDYGDATPAASAAYSAGGGVALTAYADMRITRRLYLTVSLGFTRLAYTSTYRSAAERNVMSATTSFYMRGPVDDRFRERYTLSQLEVAALASYRLPVTRRSHVQLSCGPVLLCGLKARLHLTGTADSEQLTAYVREGDKLTSRPSPDFSALPLHIAADGRFNLYSDYVSYRETYTEQGGEVVNKSQYVAHAPLRRVGAALRLAAAYEWHGLAFGLSYDFMLSNMANGSYANASRWAPFDYNAAPMTAYRQRLHTLRLTLGYTLRY